MLHFISMYYYCNQHLHVVLVYVKQSDSRGVKTVPESGSVCANCPEFPARG